MSRGAAGLSLQVIYLFIRLYYLGKFYFSIPC
jgi:hypothetical protein